MDETMKKIELIQQVDVENIYNHVLALEGPRYPLDNLEALNAAAVYIRKTLESYGLPAEFQEFSVDGLASGFKNVLGFCGDREEPAVLLGSHYDSVPDCPGANDNLSAVAISLEFARVISKLERPPAVVLAFFTLEEGHPGVAKQMRDLKEKYNVIDSKGRYKTARLLQYHREIETIQHKYFQMGESGVEGMTAFLSSIETELSGEYRSYFQALLSLMSQFDPTSSFEERGLLGSNYFVNHLDQLSQPIRYVINFDTLGWIKEAPKTQKPLPIPPDLVETYKVDSENEIGNFITIIGDENSGDLLGKFTQKCKMSQIDVPYTGIHLPFSYEVIKSQVPDSLRMDHAPFWRKQIPAITMSDGANFRSELYHTPADVSKYMDFEMLAKILKATLATVLDV